MKTIYNVPINEVKFFCQYCNKNVDCIRWKQISEHINYGSKYKCDNCWNK